jgi:hypothetical protein
MKLPFTIAAALLCLSAYSQDFIEFNQNTKWINEVNELSFLERSENDTNIYKAYSETSYLFYIDVDEDYYSITDLERERSVVRNCCMCSYTAILKNSKDTLQIEKGSSDDFGNSTIIIDTFYKENENLVQVKLLDDNTTVVTIWKSIISKN